MSKKTASEESRLDDALGGTFPASDPTSYGAETKVRDNKEMGRFEADLDGQTATLSYVRGPGTIRLVETRVPKAILGRGIEDLIAHHALKSARREGLKALVECKDVADYVRRHPEYNDVAEIVSTAR